MLDDKLVPLEPSEILVPKPVYGEWKTTGAPIHPNHPARGRKKTGGRRKGGTTIKSRAIAMALLEEGIAPLQVLVEAMVFHHELYREEKAKPREEWDRPTILMHVDRMVEAAEKAAPYMHPKLASVQHSAGDGQPFKIVISSEDAEV